jgi:hypothetical protein
MKKFVAVLVLAAALAMTAGVDGRSAGAPGTSADGGCTCHGAASTAATVALSGLDDVQGRVLPGDVLNLTLTVTGPAPLPAGLAMNTGGFAIKASHGDFSTKGIPTLQLLDAQTLTHTSQGNDQRSWSFAWTAPIPAPADHNVTFWYAGNAVNGDGGASSDAWAKAVKVLRMSPGANNATAPTPTLEGKATPGLSAALAGAALLAGALVRARRD